MSQTPDVVVVGGGIVGSACAWHLAQHGRRVRVIEPGEPVGEAWKASAGMLTPQIKVDAEDALFELGIAGREFYREQAGPLQNATGIDIEFREGGILEVATTEAEVETLKGRVGWQRQHGHQCEWLDPEEIRREWPWLGPTLGGQLAPQDGAVDPSRTVLALRADAERRGVELVADRIVSITRDGRSGRLTGVEGRDRHPAGQVVLAAGAWTGRLANLPRPVSVEPVRGQLAAYPWPAAAPPAIVFGHGGYLLPRLKEAIAGSTWEHAGFANQTTGLGIASIAERVGALVPGLSGARVLRSWAGLRPGTPDGLPIVGPEPELEGLWYATGHGRSGVLLAGITGRIIVDLMASEGTFHEAAAMRPERFWSR